MLESPLSQPTYRTSPSPTSSAPTSSVTCILSAIEQGDGQAAEELLPLVYNKLRKLANEKSGQTQQATALVYEAYVSESRSSPSALDALESLTCGFSQRYAQASEKLIRSTSIASPFPLAALMRQPQLIT